MADSAWSWLYLVHTLTDSVYLWSWLHSEQAAVDSLCALMDFCCALLDSEVD